MPNRDRILDAAARIYCACGFRGATTRRIAEEAGVNEVTLFRLFGSKAALIGEAVQRDAAALPALPDEPGDVERELTAWCAAQLDHLRRRRALIRTTMGELAERPELLPCATGGPVRAVRAVRRYLTRLQAQGRLAASVHTPTAAAMLLGTLFADAMGRDIMPEMYPTSPAAAVRAYVRLFLRGVNLAPAAPRKRRGGASPASRPAARRAASSPPTQPAKRRIARRA